MLTRKRRIDVHHQQQERKKRCTLESLRSTARILSNDLSKDHLLQLINIIELFGDDELTKEVHSAEKQSHNLKQPFDLMPPELLVKILQNSFSNVREALQLALVCNHWYVQFKTVRFWKSFLQIRGKSDTGFDFLFNNLGPQAAVQCKFRVGSKQNTTTTGETTAKWCHIQVSPKKIIMGGLYEKWIEKIRGSYFMGFFFNGPAVIIDEDREEVYQGNLLKDKPDGKGLLTFANGSYYDGQWKDGKKHGAGIEVNVSKNDSQRIVGTWNEDLLHGPFVHTWTFNYGSSHYFRGTAVNGRWSGPGTYYYPNGDRHELTFVDDIQEGASRQYLANGNVVHFTYKRGKIVPPITVVYPNGDRFEGVFSDGVPKGNYYKLQSKDTPIPPCFER